jgi:hypothetical protein
LTRDGAQPSIPRLHAAYAADLEDCRAEPVADGAMTEAVAWFSRVGLPLATAETAGIRALLGADSCCACEVFRGIAHWQEVGEIIRAPDWEDAAWEREEEERQRLWQRATERIDESALLRRLADVTDALAGPARGDAAAAAARGRAGDSGLVRAASSAALMAAHQSALARLAGEDATHFFVRRFALFEGGRWPLGEYRRHYVVF